MKIAVILIVIMMIILIGCSESSTTEPPKNQDELAGSAISKTPVTLVENSHLTSAPTGTASQTATTTSGTPQALDSASIVNSHLSENSTSDQFVIGEESFSDQLSDFTWRLSAVSIPNFDQGSWIELGRLQRSDYPITLVFNANTISGTINCVDYSAPFEIIGETLAIGELSISEVICPEPEVLALEDNYMNTLPKALTYELDDDNLRIYCSGSYSYQFERLPYVIPRMSVDIKPSLGSSFCDGDLKLIDAYVESDISSQSYDGFSTSADISVDIGDRYYVVRGQFKNESNTGYWVGHYAYGYDIEVNKVAWTVYSAHIVGENLMGIRAHQTREFEIHMNYADNLSLVQIGAFCSVEPPP